VICQWWIWKHRRKDYNTALALSLVTGGATGNLLNRIFWGKVLNFLDFYFGRHHWPAFSLADVAIVVGAGLLLYHAVIHRIPTGTAKKAAAG
jgi:signal peptidase II